MAFRYFYARGRGHRLMFLTISPPLSYVLFPPSSIPSTVAERARAFFFLPPCPSRSLSPIKLPHVVGDVYCTLDCTRFHRTVTAIEWSIPRHLYPRLYFQQLSIRFPTAPACRYTRTKLMPIRRESRSGLSGLSGTWCAEHSESSLISRDGIE